MPQSYQSVWAQYTIRPSSGDREYFIDRLSQRHIPIAVYYAKPLHLQPAFRSLGYRTGMFPVAEKLSDSVFSLPMHPYLKEGEIEKISNVLME